MKNATDALYMPAVAVSILVWFTSIAAPLWLDETATYWQISAGAAQVWARRGVLFPAYNYILWAWSQVFGIAEVTLRIPSILAMLGAALVIFRIARFFFDHDAALFATISFCLNPIVVNAASDARPYAFAVLDLSLCVLVLLQWTRTNQLRYAVWLGVFIAGLFYFHYLFVLMTLPLAVLLAITAKPSDANLFRKQLSIAGVVLILLTIPVLPAIVDLFHAGGQIGQIVFAPKPRVFQIAYVLNGLPFLSFVSLFLIIAAGGHVAVNEDKSLFSTGTICLMLCAIPLGILFAVSRWTSLNVFVYRYTLMAVPGVALCCGYLFNRIDSKIFRLLACLLFLFAGISPYKFTTHAPHFYSWKEALGVADATAHRDGAPLLICSDFAESNFRRMPQDPYHDPAFAPLSYYHVSSRVVPLPRSVTSETKRQVDSFLQTSVPERRRFLLLTYIGSKGTIRWVAEHTSGSYSSRPIGVFDDVTVTEFILKDN
ncbi:MAG: glycosyltransferase family 39 protein [Terriglobia bacterium]|nr:glycosyltransferase family 39 protein [Terriglobia bacterium]